MEQSPSRQANQPSTIQEIPHILLNSKDHYRLHKSQSLFPILSQISPVHASQSHVLKIHIHIILPSMPRFSMSFSIWFPHQHSVYTSCVHHTCPTYLILHDFTTRITQGDSKVCMHREIVSVFIKPALYGHHYFDITYGCVSSTRG